MRPEIEAYLRDHGDKYTTKALRAQLIHAGHDPAEVDAALAETNQARAAQFAATRELRGRFWRWAFLINLVVLVGVTAVAAQRTSIGVGVLIVLGIALLIGLGISGSIGRSLLPRNGLLVALVAPAVAALVLGGWCMAIVVRPTL